MKEKIKHFWREELKPGHDEVTTILKSQQNEIEEEENFRLKGSILYDCIGIIGEGLVFGGLPASGIGMKTVALLLDEGHIFYSKGNIMEKLKNAEKILKKYDAIRMKMNSYLSPSGGNKFSSLKSLIKDIQNIISHIEPFNNWKWLPDILINESPNLSKLFQLGNDKNNIFITGASIAHRVKNIVYNFKKLMDGKMCKEATVLENIIEEIQSEYDDMKKVLFET